MLRCAARLNRAAACVRRQCMHMQAVEQREGGRCRKSPVPHCGGPPGLCMTCMCEQLR